MSTSTELHRKVPILGAAKGCRLARITRARKARPKSRAGRPPKEVSEAHQTRERILRAATVVFAQHGLGGGRVKLVARAAKSNERMIYYYFGSKEGLFIAVLENVYRQMWEAENALQLERAPPVQAIKSMVDFTLDHYLAHPEMLTILNNENLPQGAVRLEVQGIEAALIPGAGFDEQDLWPRGRRWAVSPGARPDSIYLSILALNYFYVSNRHTLSAYLGLDLTGKQLERWRRWVADIVVRAVQAP